MWRCLDCDEKFDAPVYETICAEEYYGVSSMFGNYNYIDICSCLLCGSSDIEEFYEEDEYDD